MHNTAVRAWAVLIVLIITSSGTAFGKTGPTYWTEARVSEMRDNAKRDEADLRRCLEGTPYNFHGTRYFSADTLAGLSDEKLWNLMPPTTMKRKLSPSELKGCPVHGLQVRQFDSYYPWKIDCINHPYKIQCPVGGEWYPSNDYAAGDMTSGKYADDGTGCKLGDDTYYFVQHYAYAAFLGCVRPGIRALARSYGYTGEPKYAHACAIMLARVAKEYPNSTDKRQLCYNGNYGNISGMICDHVWANDTLQTTALAYDQIYDYLPQHPELMGFLSTKVSAISEVASYRKYVEDNLLRAGGQSVIDGATLGNTGMAELTIATVALILDDHSDQRPNSADMMQWLYHGQGGMLWLGNQLYKDGFSYESMSYNGARRGYIWALERAEQLQSLHPDQYPLREYPMLTEGPKFKALTTFQSRAACLGRYRPAVGDAGGYMKTPAEPPKRSIADQTKGELFDGYGLGILRQGGSGENQRALWLFYGGLLGHRHDDPLNLGLMGYGYNLLPELGYPASWRYRWSWEGSIAAHNTVVVDGVTQIGRLIKGQANYFVDGPNWTVIQAEHAPYTYDAQYCPDQPLVPEYQRTSALVGISDQAYYVFDLFRVTGGVHHQLCWHGPDTAGDMTYDGPELAAQDTGSAAGPDIERGAYYRNSAGRVRDDAFGWMKNVRRGIVAEPVLLDWAVKDEADTHLAMHLLPHNSAELTLAKGQPPAQPSRYTAEFAILAQGAPRPPEPWISQDKSEIVIEVEDFSDFDSVDDYFWETKNWAHLPGGQYVGGASGRAYKADKTITCDRYTIPAGDYKLFLRVVNYNKGRDRVQVQVNGVKGEVAWEPVPLTEANSFIHWTRGVILRGVPAGNQLSITTVQADQAAVSIDNIYLTTDLFADPPESTHPLLAHIGRDEQQLRSRFVTLIEPYQSQRHIAAVTRLEAEGSYSGAVIELANGCRDLILASDTPGQPVEAQGLSVMGELGMIRLRGEDVEAAHLLRGTSLSYKDCLVSISAGREECKITVVDREANSVTVVPALTAPQLLAGRWVRIHNQFRSGMYRAKEAHNTGLATVISLEGSANLSEGHAVGFRDGLVRNGFVPMPFAGARQRVDGTLDLTNAWFRGSYLSDENGRHQWQVKGVLCNRTAGVSLHGYGYYDVVLAEEVGALTLQHGLAPSNRFVLWDYGVGDMVEIVHSAHLQATREDSWQLVTSGPVKLQVPGAVARVQIRSRGSEEWTDSPNPVIIDADKLSACEWEIRAQR